MGSDLSPPTVAKFVQLGHVLYAQGRYPEAVAALTEALRLDPGDAALWNDRGIMLGTLQRFAEALTSYDKAITLAPTFAQAHYNRGCVLGTLLKHDQALESYDRAVACKSDFALAWNNRGTTLAELGRGDEALASYDRALMLSPTYAEALGNRAAVLTSLRRHGEALASADSAIALGPNIPEFYNHRAIALTNLRRPEEALLEYEKAIALRPDFAAVYRNRASALLDLQRPDEALSSCAKAIAIDPDAAEAHNMRGVIFTELKRLDEALACCDKAIALRPNYAEAWGNRGMLLLLTGQTSEGWASFRRREQLLRAKSSGRDVPPWRCGEDICGKTLFIDGAGGFGDAIQFCRRITNLEAEGAKIICALPRPIIRLLKDISATARFFEAAAPVPQCDRHVSFYNLAEGFPPDERHLSDVPYLHADTQRVQRWKNLIGDDGFKVGICWQGSMLDAARFFPPTLFESLGGIPNMRLISLQKGARQQELSGLADGMTVETLGETYDACPDAFLDAAAVMENLDLVIAPDTAIAHLAGALGRPVWVALKYVSDWRWGLDSTRTPWYPSMRLFRQQAFGDWPSVFAAMRAELLVAMRDL